MKDRIFGFLAGVYSREKPREARGFFLSGGIKLTGVNAAPVTPHIQAMRDLTIALDNNQGPFVKYRNEGLLSRFNASPDALSVDVKKPPGPRSEEIRKAVQAQYPNLKVTVRRSAYYCLSLADAGLPKAQAIASAVMGVTIEGGGLRVISRGPLDKTAQSRIQEALQDGGEPRLPVIFPQSP